MPATITPVEPLINRTEAARILGVKPQTLAVWAHHNRYPIPAIKIGRSVRYRASELQAWIEKHRTVEAI